MLHIKKILLFITCSAVLLACSPKLYNSENQYESGSLSDGKLDSLKIFLKENTRTELKDTIFIKYDFNKDVCWKDLNYQNATFLNDSRFAYQNYVKEKSAKRPSISVYQYRGEGDSFSPIKSKGLEIETDSGFLKNLLFKEQTTCGTSAIILPSGKYLLIKSDSHFAALLLSGKEIENLIIGNLIK
ncbi:hypothetical protein ACFOG5_10080 [Pedobacter fastidiosus]|uniref:Lipoprotein n=1 Tax=Pedobacter fastidiosus TaxID=2765361 RepID=A0ABR7KX49_9SPHI|nr:hypothetical protein [Pedobacter fastidiosus]MBC6112415.1 hypothetical protein [Pedobacter fastidiosus]